MLTAVAIVDVTLKDESMRIGKFYAIEEMMAMYFLIYIRSLTQAVTPNMCSELDRDKPCRRDRRVALNHTIATLSCCLFIW